MRTLAAIALTLAMLTGCEGGPSFTDHVRDLDVVITEGENKVATLPPGPEREKAKKVVAAAKADRAEYLERIKTAGDNPNEYDEAQAVVDTGAKYIPAPWNLIALGASTLLGVFAETKRRKTKRAAEDIVDAIETAKDDNGAVNFTDPKTKQVLRASMSKDARAMVEKARKPK